MYDNPKDLKLKELVELVPHGGVPTIYTVEEFHPTGWAEDVVRLVAHGLDFYLSYSWSPANGINWRRATASSYSPTAERGVWCARKHCPEPYQEYAAANMPNGEFLCFSCRADGYGTTWAVDRFAKDPK